MAWVSPMTFVANSVLTAAQLNTHLRDNLNETAPAKATAAGQIFVSTGANSIAARLIDDDIVETAQATTSTTYTDLTTVGPTVTVTSGILALVTVTAECENNTAGATASATFEISGATTTAPSDIRRIKVTGTSPARMSVQTLMGVTPGSNTFKMVYRASSNTATFTNRRLHVWPL